MPKLSAKTKDTKRILIVGDPGAGKTAAVGYLLNHGQRLFVADFDDKLNVIRKCVKPAFHENLIFEPLVDKVRPDPVTGYPRTLGKPTAFRRFIKLTEKWVDSTTMEDFGDPADWGENDWLVIDSLTSMGRAALLYMQDQRNSLGKKPSLPTLGEAMERVEGTAAMLRSFPINSIMLAHLSPLSGAEDLVMDNPDESDETKTRRAEAKLQNPHSNKRYPYTLGKKLPRHIGGYFSVVLQAKTVGSGEKTTRVLRTVPDNDVDVSVPAALKQLKSEYPLDGLWEIIKILRETEKV